MIKQEVARKRDDEEGGRVNIDSKGDLRVPKTDS